MKIARFSLLLGFSLVLAPLALADSAVLYNNIPSPLPGNIVSIGYEAAGAGEFGGLIQFAGSSSSYSLTSATVVMSDWTYASQWTSAMNGTTITSSGFYLPVTLTLYSVGDNGTVGSVIATETLDNAFIPWRPEHSAGCGGAAWMASNGVCYNGSLSTLTFNLSGLTVPDQIIYGLSYNTTNYGADPTHVAGPYESLNFGLSSSAPTVGSNPLPNTAYWETVNAGNYFDGGAGGTGTFRQDSGWSPYSGAIEFEGPAATPEPSSWMLFGTGLLGLAVISLRRSRLFQS